MSLSDWDDPVPADKVRYRDAEYDSKLEVEWALLFDRHAFDEWYHPGSVRLWDGTVWEPDWRVGEVLCEAKGPHNERLWKAQRAAQENELPVIMLRAGKFSEAWDDEKRGAEWESVDGAEWVMVIETGHSRFEREEDAAGDVRYPASRCMVDSSLMGIEMPHWSEAMKDE